ncbi:hypothetical protein Tco_0858002 [Tanacetum coccineum]|uniref:Uncharacterized protein n=1 Tax=Tanacetum coccineum TaxID=301880 RepID=A0ABQ5B845_9ASTR
MIKRDKEIHFNLTWSYDESTRVKHGVMRFSLSATLTSSQKILTLSLEHFDVVIKDFDAVSTYCMPSHDHLRVKLQSCPVSSQIESKSRVFPPNTFQMLK